jgi:hypothetical protein
VKAHAWLAVLLCAGAGCASLPTGTFEDRAFAGPKHGYEISYASTDGTRELIPGWRVDNFVYAKGRPDATKNVETLRATLEWKNNNGETIWVDELARDLDLTHRASGASIWVTELAMTEEVRGMRLDRIAERWANAFGGAHTTRAFGGPAKRITTKVLDSDSAEVDGLTAHRVVFEVVNLDQRELDPDAPRIKVVGVLVGTPLKKTLHWKTQEFDVPALLFFGYANDEDEFDDLLPDFEGLLKRARITSVTKPRTSSVPLTAHE